MTEEISLPRTYRVYKLRDGRYSEEVAALNFESDGDSEAREGGGAESEPEKGVKVRVRKGG